jgi:hypothetical protein
MEQENHARVLTKVRDGTIQMGSWLEYHILIQIQTKINVGKESGEYSGRTLSSRFLSAISFRCLSSFIIDFLMKALFL